MKKKYSVSSGLDLDETKYFRGCESLGEALAFAEHVRRHNKYTGPQTIWKHHDDAPPELVGIYFLGDIFVKSVIF